LREIGSFMKTMMTLARAPERGVTMDDRHYSVQEVAQMLSISERRVRKLFEDEPGVIKLPGPTALRGAGKEGRKGWIMLRIPDSVLHRVYNRLRAFGESASLVGKLKRPSRSVE
jgi:hypothetical protein